MAKVKSRAEQTTRAEANPKVQDDHTADDLALRWRDLLTAGTYDFLDFGCSKSGLSAFADQKLGLKSGLGIDPDPKRVATARGAGANAVATPVIGLSLPSGAVSAVIISNFLNRLRAPDLARQVIGSALDVARDYVLVRQPFFDANPQLLALGFEPRSAERPGYPTLMTSDHVWRAAQRHVEAGRADFYVLGRKRILNSEHVAIAPLNIRGAFKAENGSVAEPSPPIRFDFPVFSEMVAIIVKRGKSGPKVDWKIISKALGCDSLLIQVASGGLSATGFVGSSKPKAEKDVRRHGRIGPTEADQAMARRYLFVCGVARSGTTVLTEMLNLHPQVSIGVERYKNLSNSGSADFGPQLFEKQRFFDFRDEDTNVNMPKVYENLKDKYDRSLYVGDKVPRYYRKIGKILDLFDPVKIVFISRDIRSVSFSWNERADNPKDSWPTENDFTVAVGEWNKGNKIALAAAREHPDRFAVVNYDAVIKQGLAPIERLLNWLELDTNEAFRQAYHRIIARAPAKREKIPKPGQDAFITQHADDETFQAVRALAL